MRPFLAAIAALVIITAAAVVGFEMVRETTGEATAGASVRLH